MRLVVQRENYGWEVIGTGVLKAFLTKNEAIKYARKLAGDLIELLINDNGNVKTFKNKATIKEHIEYSLKRHCWELFNENGIRGQREFNTKIKAIRYARKQCEGYNAEMYIQEGNGEIRLVCQAG